MEKGNLVGTWKLVSASATASTGERDEAPYGTGPSGFLTYTADGRVTALISYGGRKPLSMAPKVEEQAEAFKTSFGYSGTFSVNGDQVAHRVEVSTIQNFVNRDLVRTAKLEGDRLVLVTPPTPMNGKVQTVELTWQRLS
jgi:hypothetical protein